MAEEAAPAKPRRRWGWLAWAALALGAALFVAIRILPGTDAGRSFIVEHISGLKVGRLGHLRLAGLTGDPWGRFAVARLEIDDQDGAWLLARNIEVRWRPGELLRARFRIASLGVGRVTLLRRFTPTPGGPPKPSPVAIRIDHAALTLETLPAFSVNRGLFAMGGRLFLSRSNQPIGAIDARSLLRPGDRLTAGFDFNRHNAFDLAVAAREARGGALAGALGLATSRDFGLDIAAHGKRRVGDFTLTARSGDTLAADARGHWTAKGGDARGRISLVASTLLAAYQGLIGPEVRFRIDGRDVSKTLYRVVLAAGGDKAAFTAAGEIDPARRATGPRGLQLALRIDEAARLIKTGAAGALRLRGGLGGDQTHWVFAGAGSVERPVIGGLSYARVTGPLRVEGARDVVLKTTLKGEGGQGGGLAAGLLGAKPVAAAEIAFLADRRIELRHITLDGADLKLVGEGRQGLLGDLSFSGQTSVADLARARMGAHGGVAGTFTARQSGRGPWVFGVDARGVGFGLGVEQIDHLLGPTPTLKAKGVLARDVINLEQVLLSGRDGGISAAGKVGPAGALKVALTWRATGPIPVGPVEIAGSAKGTGDISGTLANPTADLIADLTTVDVPSLALRDAHIVARLQDFTGPLSGRFSLAAASQYGPAKAAAAFRLANGGVEVSGLDADAGGLKAIGGFVLANGAPSTAELTWTLSPGAFLASGQAAGHVRLSGVAGAARADLAVSATEAALRGGPLFHSLRLTASGPMLQLPYRTDASGLYDGTPFRVSGAGVFSQATATATENVATFAGSGRVRGVDVRTIAPARVAFGPGRYHAALALGAAGGQIDLNVTGAGARVTGRASLSAVNLNTFDPDYVGVISGDGQLSGEGAALSGNLTARVSKVGVKGQKGVSALDGDIRATLAGSTLRFDTDLTSGQGSGGRIAVDLPVVATASPFRVAIARLRPMSGTFAIDADLAPLWVLTMGDEQTLAGRLAAKGALGGTLADPRLTGTADLSGGRFVDSATGLKLQAVSLQAAMRDNAIDVSSFQGQDAGRGTVQGSGRIGLQRDGVSDLQLVLRGFRLIDNDVGQATASGKVNVNRAADGKVKLAGDLTIDRAQIAPNAPAPSGVVAMEVTEIHRKIDPDAVPETPSAAAPVVLDVGLHAPGGVFIKGRGLNVEFSLDARVTGSTSAPNLTGAARVVQGDYNFAGQRFTLGESGVVHLGSTPETIRLDLTATRDNPTLTAVIRITGSAAKPVIELTSTPVLPRDEVLSQVLFGSSVSSLNGFQAAQLASALSGLASGGGFDVIGGIRGLAHLDRLAINSTVAGGNSIAGGKYLRDNVYLELSGGAKEGPGAQVEWRVRKHLAIVSRVTSQGDQAISVRWRRDY